MQPTLITLYTPAHRSAFGIGARLLRRLSDWARRRYAEHRQRAAVRRLAPMLAELDDRTLRDLGLHRSQLAALAYAPRDAERAPVLRSNDGSRDQGVFSVDTR